MSPNTHNDSRPFSHTQCLLLLNDYGQFTAVKAPEGSGMSTMLPEK
jgi:hypothetical protein